jgi:hypothetical protein
MKSLARFAAILALAASASAQSCPKVSYSSNTPATLKSLIAAVNCLSATSENAASAPVVHEAPPAKAAPKGGMQVESFQIVGPQHSRTYSQVVLAVLTVPTGGSTKTAVVTPDTHEASVTAEAGGSCSVKINSDKTVDSRCYLAGGTVYIVYR